MAVPVDSMGDSALFLTLNKDLRSVIYKYLTDLDLYSLRHVCKEIKDELNHHMFNYEIQRTHVCKEIKSELKDHKYLFNYEIQRTHFVSHNPFYESPDNLFFLKWFVSSLSDQGRTNFVKMFLNEDMLFVVQQSKNELTKDQAVYYIYLLTYIKDEKIIQEFLITLVKKLSHDDALFITVFKEFVDRFNATGMIYHNSLFYRNIYIDYVLTTGIDYFKDRKCIDLLVELYGPPRRFPWFLDKNIYYGRRYFTYWTPWNYDYCGKFCNPVELEKYHWLGKNDIQKVINSVIVGGVFFIFASTLERNK